MPTVLLSRTECERNHLPRVCARCGRPADGAVRLSVPTPAVNTLMAGLLVLFPPAFLVAAVTLARRWGMDLPMCPADQADWQRRDRITSRTYLVFVVGTYLVAPAVALVGARPYEWSEALGMAAVVYLLVWTAWLFPSAVRWTRTVRTTRVSAQGLRLSGVHPAFVAAVRDARANDPDRQAWYGDIRDDYDDEPS